MNNKPIPIFLIIILAFLSSIIGGILAFQSYDGDAFLNDILQALVPINITSAIGLGTIAISVSEDSVLKHILPINITIIILTGLFSLLLSFVETSSGIYFIFKRVYFFYNVLLLVIVTVQTVLRSSLAPKTIKKQIK